MLPYNICLRSWSPANTQALPPCHVTQEEARQELLQMSQPQLEDVARVCNRYPDIQLAYSLPGGADVPAGGQVLLVAELER